MDRTPVGPGTLLAGRYLLEDLLDETEGARFWRATDRILARNVAVHVISSDDPRGDALLNAARTSATVTDGHLLRVLDAATEDGITYVVNEWGHGVSMDQLLAEGPLSARRAAWVAKEVAEAISTAHRHGIAHGRLLPENVMVTEAGSVKLIGFVVDAVLRRRDRARTPAGRLLDEHESDVVNLAALLYAGLTARWPGTAGSDVPEAPTEHGRPLRPRRVRAGVPRPLDAICERVLGVDGPEAPGLTTAHEIYAALCDFVGDPSGPPPVEFEPTVFFDEEELTELRREDRTGDPASPASSATSAAGGPPAGIGGTGAGVPSDDTVAAAPVFDETVGAGWAAGADPEATQAAPAPDPTTSRASAGPPPLFPEAEPRPLFASDQPRRAQPTGRATAGPAGEAATTSGGTLGPAAGPAGPAGLVGPAGRAPARGPLPPAWGPDDDGDDDPDQWDTSSWTDDPPGRSWFRLAVVVASVVLVVVAVVVAFNLGRGREAAPDATDESPSGAASRDPATPVPVTAVSDFDPAGDGSENPESAPAATDGDAGTAWRTSTYYDPLELQKDGVGLLLDLGEPTAVSGLEVRFLGGPTSFEVLAAPKAGSAPTSTAGLRQVAARRDAGARADVTLEQPVTTRHLVLWLTKLPPADGGFRGQVAEVVVRR